jgi:hypothetical protein
MIIVQRVSIVSFWPLAFIGLLLGRLHYISISQKASKLIQPRGKRIVSKLARNLLPVPISTIDRMSDFKIYNYGNENYLRHYCEKYLSPSLVEHASNFFVNIVDHNKKFSISLVTSLNYDQLGIAILFTNSLPQGERVYFIHTSLRSYLLRSSGSKGAEKYYHLYLPIDDLIKFLGSVRTKLGSFFLGLILKTPENTEQFNSEKNISERTAILYHQSVHYGPLFDKTHYFSSDIRSPLHKKNVACFVLGRHEWFDIIPDSAHIPLVDIAPRYKRSDLFLITRFFLKGLFKVRKLSELVGLIFLTFFYKSYLEWRRSFEGYPKLRNVIIDYDILFPKPLSVALESLGIRTLAMQERAVGSFYHNCGAIADTYFFGGGLYTRYGASNKSYSYRVPVNFGNWRTSLIYNNSLPDIQKISFISFGNRSISDFDSMICCLGWFTQQENPASSVALSREATLEYFSRIKSLVIDFPSMAIVLRMKILYKSDRSMIEKHFAGIDNFFLCDDYSQASVSYAICKEASVIVSVQTSLADECLVVGKKVVLIDSTHNIRGLYNNIYPQDFQFAIADGSKEINALVTRCLNGDPELSAQYQELSSKLSGDFDLTIPNAIPKALEIYLQ